MPQPSRLEIDRALFELRQALLAEDIVERFGTRHDRSSKAAAERRETEITHFEERLASGHFDDAEGFFRQAAEARCWSFEPILDGCRSRAEIDAMCRFMRLFVEVLREQARRDRGTWGGQPIDPIFTEVEVADPERPSSEHAAREPFRQPEFRPAPERADPPRSERRVVDLMDDFWINRRDNRAETRVNYEATLQLLDRFVGGRPIREITKADLSEFKGLLLRCPKNFKARVGTDDIRIAVERNKSRKLPVLSLKTIQEKYLSNLRAFFHWAKDEGLIDDDIAKGLRVSRPKGKMPSPRRPFSESELQDVFTAPLFTTCQSRAAVCTPGKVRVRDHRFWAPLIALLTGMRSNEIGQLRPRDVVDGPNGWIIECTTDTDSEDGEALHLKTESSRRQVPVHDELIRIGLLDYVDEMQKKGSSRLFPAWKRDSKGKYSGTMSKWFSRTFLPRRIDKSHGLSFHSFRHTFTDMMREAMIPEDLRRIITGHAGVDVHDQYGSRRLSRKLAEAVATIELPEGLDLSHIRYERRALPRIRESKSDCRKTPVAQPARPLRKAAASRTAG